VISGKAFTVSIYQFIFDFNFVVNRINLLYRPKYYALLVTYIAHESTIILEGKT
jgi:hypothetical protein